VRWAEVQQRLGVALDANRPGSTTPHVVISLPSLNIADSLLAHYADRLPALEQRYLLAVALLARIPTCEMVLVCSAAPTPDVLDQHFGDLPADVRDDCRRRFHLLDVGDTTPRSLTAKLVGRPDLLARLRDLVDGRPAYIEPWNVTDAEVRLAEAIGVPVNGTSPELWHLGAKSSGRRLFREAGVPVPEGVEDVRTVDGVRAAIDVVRERRSGAPGVVVKLDDSAAGDGNRVLRFDTEDAAGPSLASLDPEYVAELTHGGIVEELVIGEPFSSPSVQLDLVPNGQPVLLSTHEQVLGGVDAQVYLGCRFPAEEEYAAQIGALGLAAAEALARRGALGRVGIDFAVGREPDGSPRVCALEVNLRKGGTTHPYAALRNLVPGHYDAQAGRWFALDGTPRFYEATDNLVEEDWTGRDPREVVGVVRRHGMAFDHGSGTGVVLHMLSCLAIDGRLGLTAFGSSREHAQYLFAETSTALRR
jgi:hypothetical protein